MAGPRLGDGSSLLPPAGDARREVLRERADTLAEQAEGMEGGSVRPDAFTPIPEIQRSFDELEVPNAQPEFAYCWVEADPRYSGRFVNAKRAEGWEVVTGNMPEAAGSQVVAVDNTMRIGDVILMRIPRDRALTLKRQQEARQRAIQTGITTELEELGARYAPQGVIVHTAPSDQLLKTMGARAFAQQQAGARMDNMIRTGTVPGRRMGRG